MNRQELLEEIRRLKIVEKLPDNNLYSIGFINQEKYLHIAVGFEQNQLKDGEEWHQIVRFALNSDTEQNQYMYKRLLFLLLRHRRSYNSYFQLKSERGTTLFPDRISDINRLFILYQRYFQIFNSTIKRIHFDYPLTSSMELTVNGKINWGRTIKTTVHDFPLTFDTSKWKREFDVPENILLLLPALWLNHESKKLLRIDFIEPLSIEEKSTLNQISNKTQDIALFFPFHNLLQSAKRFASLSSDDRRIRELERMTELRINTGIVRADPYRKLLGWIKEFRELNLRMMSSTRSNFPMETIKNLDTIYEAWIFFEFVDFFSKIGKLTALEIDSKLTYFEINLAGHIIRFFHEREFHKNQGHAWAVYSKPDFVVMEENTILAIFDAKNFGADSMHKGEAYHKILAYLTNLDCGYGGLFFPNIDRTIEMRFPPGNSFARHHFNLKVGHYLIKPSGSDDAIAMKAKTLQDIFEEIIKRAHIDLKF